MGYTHYWNREPDVPDSTWDKAAVACAAASVAAKCLHGVRIVDATFTGPDGIWFDGEGDQGYETFAVKRGYSAFPHNGWDFCKTARRRYDTLVVACLALLHHHGIVHPYSDGKRPDWEAGAAIAWVVEPGLDVEAFFAAMETNHR